tara:strand:- start:16352 stop:16726 length:375 start_codon:yes stop_codon:yes gene_type:complete
MVDNKKENKFSTSNKAPKILVNFYGIMAVIFVIVPEWIAEFGIRLENYDLNNELPKNKNTIDKDTYLYISNLEINQLRLMASKLRIMGYSAENKRSLQKRILKSLKRRKSIEFIQKSLIWKSPC